MKLKLTLLALSFFVLNNFSHAQSSSGNYGLPKKKDFDRLSAGISFGPNYFQADLQKNSKNNNSLTGDLPFNPMFGPRLAYQLTHSVGVRAGGMFGKFTAEGEAARNVKGKEAVERLYEYESNVKEGTLDLVFTAGNISFLQRNKKFHFIGSIGIGMFNFDGELLDVDPRPLADSTELRLIKTGNITEGMATLGLGFKYQVGKRVDAGFTFDFRKSFTDNVDAIDKRLTETDNYSILSININYTFGKKNQQLEWVNPMEVVYNDMAELKDKMDVLSGDKDKDGVSDMFDKDNSTPEGNKVYGDGTSIDTDGDGVSDPKDGDPFSQKGAHVDANGVETDADGDGVADSRDLEPNSEKGSLVNFQGITISKAAAAAAAAAGGSTGWMPPVFFSLNKTDISGVQRDRVLIVARILKNNPEIKLKLTGNCDVTAGEEYNDKLGLKRADAVKDHLVKVYGIDPSRLTTESKGEKEPLAKGLNPMNRRVDFSVME